jgi:predicted nucleotidyltransferase
MVEIKNIPLQIRGKGIGEKLTKVCEDNGIVFMAIFGSFIKGTQKRRSDIDILIKFKKNSSKTLLDLVALEHKLQNVFKRKVDIVEMEGLTNRYVREDVFNTMKVIYEKG